MKLIKPETAMNKEVALNLSSGFGDMFASKISDTFEDALLVALDALKAQIEKKREKMKYKIKKTRKKFCD